MTPEELREYHANQPWPKAGQIVFHDPVKDGSIRRDKRNYIACVNWGFDIRDGYEAGYQEAADLLMQSIRDNKACLDLIVYPFVFLHRQQVELRLKRLITDVSCFLREPMEFPPDHRLMVLWRLLRPLMERAGGPRDLDHVEALLKQFDAIDAGSFTFRYYITTKGKRTLPEDLDRIDLENFHDVMTGLHSLLEGWVLETERWEDNRRQTEDLNAEYAREMRAEMEAEYAQYAGDEQEYYREEYGE